MKRSREIYRVYQCQSELVIAEFGDIVEKTVILHHPSGEAARLRVFLVDETVVDVWYSAKGKYSYHWDAQIARGSIYRVVNKGAMSIFILNKKQVLSPVSPCGKIDSKG